MATYLYRRVETRDKMKLVPFIYACEEVPLEKGPKNSVRSIALENNTRISADKKMQNENEPDVRHGSRHYPT